MIDAAEMQASDVHENTKRELTDQERQKRHERLKRKKATYEANNVGRRLIWIRSKLEITHADIERGTDIPMSTYNDWESNIRTGHWEALAILAAFFNELWRVKFPTSFPLYEGDEIAEVTPLFVMFGQDLKNKELLELKSEYKEKMNDIIFELEMKEKELREMQRNQLNILDLCNDA